MKTYKSILSIFLWSVIFCFSNHTFSQEVGINTTTPRKTLEVAGDMKISNTLEIGTMLPLKDSDNSTFLIQEADQTIKSLDVSNPTGAALGYIQEYVIYDPEEDWILDFDTGVDATDFVLVATSAYYDRELDLSDHTNETDNSSMAYCATFVENGTWHIIADFPVAATLNPTEIGTWTISTIIYSSDLSKQFGSIDIPMSHSTTGSAVTPIID